MKILVNATAVSSNTLTGIERFCLNITKELYLLDGKLCIVASRKIPGISTAIISRLLAFASVLLGRREYFLRTFWDQTLFRSLVSRLQPDVVFFPIQDGFIFPSVKQIITVHDLHYRHFNAAIPECSRQIPFLRSMLYRYKMPHILQRSAAVVAVSEATKQDIIHSFGIDSQKIQVIYNGYDDSRFRVLEDLQSTLDRYALKSGNYFLFVGSILRHKNLVRLVQAFACLKSEASLVIAGTCKDDAYLGELTKTAADVGISIEKFRYLQYVSDNDLPILYNGALAFVLPSLHEGFGVTIIEAMACGTPVITSNCSAMPEVAGGAALLVDPYAIESIASAMQETIDNPQSVESLRSAGLARAKEFSWSFSARKLYDLCKKVAGS